MNLFESALWRSRLFMVVAVVTSFALWLVMLFITTVDAVYLVRSVVAYVNPLLSPEARVDLRSQVISGIIGVLDGYLIASALFIFMLGLYHLFVNQLKVAKGSEMANRILDVTSFEDLKGRLARVIILILIVKFLQQALDIPYTSVVDIVLLALGILLVGGAYYLSHNHDGASSHGAARPKEEGG